MNKQKLMLVSVLLSLVLPAAATDVYKRVNEDGVIEFSDRPMTGGNRVSLDPNVVPTRAVPRVPRARAPTSSADAPSRPSRATGGTGVDTAAATRTSSRTRGSEVSNRARSSARTQRNSVAREGRQTRTRSTGNASRTGTANRASGRSAGTAGYASRSAPQPPRRPNLVTQPEQTKQAPALKADTAPGRALRNVAAGGGG